VHGNEEKRLPDSKKKQWSDQTDSSAFASPVLLVSKKDGTWCFCVDYHHLNAITVKHKHPMTIVDELLDELSGA
jgi:hypothetical protein